MQYRSSARNRIVAAALAGLLALSPCTAHAEESDLESLQNAAIDAGNAYEQAQERVSSLEEEISNNQERVDALEAELPAKRESASKAIKLQYKLSQNQPNLVGMLLSSTDLNEFLEQLYYLDSIASANSDAINDLNEAQSQLAATQAQLNSDLQEADAQREAAAQALQDAQAKADAAKQKAMEDAAANQAAYEAQQAAGQPDPSVTEVQASESDNTTSDEGTAAQGADSSASSNESSSSQNDTSSTTPAQESASQGATAQNSNTPSNSASTTPPPTQESTPVNYTYVGASTYGEGDGFMYGTTASGDTVTPTSMAVAMKTMPLGTIIEISYNGKTVRAVVNDRGPYAGNRQIDLQPAVAHALGFDGVGTVGYRVVG